MKNGPAGPFFIGLFGCAPLHALDVGLPVGRASGALALPQHLAQALHGFVVGVVQRVAPGCQQFHRLPDAARLVDRALDRCRKGLAAPFEPS
jgi:hypothetical protein